MNHFLKLWVLPVAIAIPVAIGGLYGIGVYLEMTGGKNWTIGFYGKFNRAKQAIETIPGVAIVDSWQHHDLTMEDFSFDLRSRSGIISKVVFSEGSPQMELSSPEEIRTYALSQISQ